MSGRQGFNIIGQGQGRSAGRAGVNPNRAAPAAPTPNPTLDVFGEDLINTRKDFVKKGNIADFKNSVKDKVSEFRGGLENALSDVQKHFNRTLFDSETINNMAVGKDGYYVVRIEPVDNGIRGTQDYYKGTGKSHANGTSIIGVIEKFPNFTINANWSEQGGLTNIAPSIGILKTLDSVGTFANNALRRTGVADRGQKFQSKKIYSKSGYLDFEITFKCINWDDTPENSPMNVALTLFSYTLPMAKFSVWDFIKADLFEGIDKLGEAIKEATPEMLQDLKQSVALGSKFVGKMGAALPGGGKALTDKLSGFSADIEAKIKSTTKAIEGEGKAAVQVADSAGVLDLAGDMGKNMFEFIDDYGIFRAAPAQVKISIGKFFENADMIIENVSVNLSEEMTAGGPLWAEFTVKLSTRTIMTDVSELGFKVWDGKKFNNIPKPKNIEETVPDPASLTPPSSTTTAPATPTPSAPVLDKQEVPTAKVKNKVENSSQKEKGVALKSEKEKNAQLALDTATAKSNRQRLNLVTADASTTWVNKGTPKDTNKFNIRPDTLKSGNNILGIRWPW